ATDGSTRHSPPPESARESASARRRPFPPSCRRQIRRRRRGSGWIPSAPWPAAPAPDRAVARSPSGPAAAASRRAPASRRAWPGQSRRASPPGLLEGRDDPGHVVGGDRADMLVTDDAAGIDDERLGDAGGAGVELPPPVHVGADRAERIAISGEELGKVLRPVPHRNAVDG